MTAVEVREEAGSVAAGTEVVAKAAGSAEVGTEEVARAEAATGAAG